MFAAMPRHRLDDLVQAVRFVADTLVVPLGVGLAVGAVLANALEPRWQAGGWVYLLQYPKNVEITATLIGLLAAGATGVLVRFGPLRWFLYPSAAAGWVVAATHVVLPAGWPLHLALLGLTVAALGALETRPGQPWSQVEPTPRRVGWRRVLIVSALILACGLAFWRALSPTRQIDVFHHGEVLASAVDLLQGGRPFESFNWPHGLHDTGLTALWIQLTDKVGLSPVTLAQASTSALAPITVFFVALSVLPASLAAALAVGLVLMTSPGGDSLSLLGRIPFAAVALALVTRARPHGGHWLAAGMAAGVQHLVRIDAGLFALLAVAVAAAWRAWADTRGAGTRLVAAVRSAGTAIAGFVAVMVANWALFGWPGRAWWQWVLGVLPTYQGDVNGLPMPWPAAWSQAAPQILEHYSMTAVTALALTAVLMAAAARWATGRTSLDRRLASWLVFVGVLAWLATRTLLGRSDAHVIFWTPFLALVVLCLAIRGARAVAGRSGAMAALAVGILLLNPNLLALHGPQTLLARGRTPTTAALSQGVRSVQEHLAPNPPDGCGDRSFTPAEMASERNRRFADASCEVEQILEFRDVRRVLYVHSAPWYSVRFATEPPSRFYTLLRLYTPDLQEELVESLRPDGLDAVFFVRGYSALSRYNDVHDGLHTPLVTAYLMERLRDSAVVGTPLGTLRLTQPAPERPVSEVASGLGRLEVEVDWMVLDEQSGFLWAKGWALDGGLEQPLQRLEVLCPEPCGTVESGLPRPGVGTREEPALARAGWELAAFLPPEAQPTLRLVPETGPAREVPLDLSAAKRLPGRSGAEWLGLRDRVQRMARLGRADREAFSSGAPP